MPTQAVSATDRDIKEGPTDASDSLVRDSSLIGRMVRLASLWDSTECRYRGRKAVTNRSVDARQQVLGEDHCNAFRAWLELPPGWQVADLQAHICSTGLDAKLFFSEQSYESLVPPSSPDTLRRLFLCGLEIALGALRNPCTTGDGLDGYRVRRMIECAWQYHGAGHQTLKELCGTVGSSDHRLGRLFKRRTGITFHRYLLLLRARRAAELLRDPGHAVKEIAASLGYADRSGFDRDFRRVLGVTPREFRLALARGGASSVTA